MSILNSIIGTKKTVVTEPKGTKSKERVTTPWHAGLRGTVKSFDRRARRAQERDRQNMQDRFYRSQVATKAEQQRYADRQAVAVLTEVERRAKVVPGTLHNQLVDEGKLPAGRVFALRGTGAKAKIGTVGHKQIAHSHRAVLHAFGMTDTAIEELYEALYDPQFNEVAGDVTEGAK